MQEGSEEYGTWLCERTPTVARRCLFLENTVLFVFVFVFVFMAYVEREKRPADEPLSDDTRAAKAARMDGDADADADNTPFATRAQIEYLFAFVDELMYRVRAKTNGEKSVALRSVVRAMAKFNDVIEIPHDRAAHEVFTNHRLSELRAVVDDFCKLGLVTSNDFQVAMFITHTSPAPASSSSSSSTA
jgi:hypothetical protein